MQDTQVWSLGQEDPLEKQMTTRCSILAWRIPWTEEPGGLQTVGVSEESDTTEQLTLSLSVTKPIVEFEIEVLPHISSGGGSLNRKVTLALAAVCAQLHQTLRPYHQAPRSIEFSRQGYWSGLPFPSPGDLPHSRVKPPSLNVSCTSRWVSYH